MTDRRTFFARLFWGLTALLGVLVGIPVIGAFLSPALRRPEASKWVAVGPAGSFGKTPTLAHHLQSSQQEGWVTTTGQQQVWVVGAGPAEYTVFDNHCTHLGCPYHWDETLGKFFCPCHNGVFDITGKVISGPPPRPLDAYETKLEGGVLYIGALRQRGRA